MNISSGALDGPRRDASAELFGPNRRRLPGKRVPCKFVPDWEEGGKGGEGESWTAMEGACRHRSKRLGEREEAAEMTKEH